MMYSSALGHLSLPQMHLRCLLGDRVLPYQASLTASAPYKFSHTGPACFVPDAQCAPVAGDLGCLCTLQVFPHGSTSMLCSRCTVCSRSRRPWLPLPPTSFRTQVQHA